MYEAVPEDTWTLCFGWYMHALFGIRPAWFADPTLAKAMLLIVNTWLGYPYFMVLCTGLIKAIPVPILVPEPHQVPAPLPAYR